MLLCHWWGTQVVDGFQHLDLHVPVQVIEVPKILSSRRRCRRRRVPVVQAAEELVEVPEFVQLAALMQQDTAAHGSPQGFLPGQDYLVVWEQIVDILVPHDFGGLGGDGGFQGFSPGQGTPAADVEQIVDIPVPQDRREGGGGLPISLPGQGSTAYLEQIVDFPARGGLHGFFPRQGSSSSSRLPGYTDEGIQGGFSHFSVKKKVRRKVRTRGRNWVRTLLHGRRRLMTPLWRLGLGLRRSWRSSAYRWMNSAAGGPDRGSLQGGGSCTTPLMAQSGGTSRVNFARWRATTVAKVEVDVLVVLVVDGVAV